ncbi:MAG: hypothetical protein C0172_02190 [Caldisphaera sp.]|jgi:uncharacterized protein (DUF302 family)|uniref:hypothetical protein n=1 Tax=Caldisphaera sp. TaxID=2060322 RepID=UPI000CAC06B9|nr:hypothetical protein [Caldisphaera sp.]PMP88632.1 MAG: hypothetical protein C0172_02190 [Caldisphaera sp.]
MSDYLDQVKDAIRSEVTKNGFKIESRGKNSFALTKEGADFMIVRDSDEQVEISYKGQRYQYDKYYTKPQHLAQVITNVMNAVLGKGPQAAEK